MAPCFLHHAPHFLDLGVPRWRTGHPWVLRPLFTSAVTGNHLCTCPCSRTAKLPSAGASPLPAAKGTWHCLMAPASLALGGLAGEQRPCSTDGPHCPTPPALLPFLPFLPAQDPPSPRSASPVDQPLPRLCLLSASRGPRVSEGHVLGGCGCSELEEMGHRRRCGAAHPGSDTGPPEGRPLGPGWPETACIRLPGPPLCLRPAAGPQGRSVFLGPRVVSGTEWPSCPVLRLRPNSPASKPAWREAAAPHTVTLLPGLDPPGPGCRWKCFHHQNTICDDFLKFSFPQQVEF